MRLAKRALSLILISEKAQLPLLGLRWTLCPCKRGQGLDLLLKTKALCTPAVTTVIWRCCLNLRRGCLRRAPCATLCAFFSPQRRSAAGRKQSSYQTSTNVSSRTERLPFICDPGLKRENFFPAPGRYVPARPRSKRLFRVTPCILRSLAIRMRSKKRRGFI